MRERAKTSGRIITTAKWAAAKWIYPMAPLGMLVAMLVTIVAPPARAQQNVPPPPPPPSPSTPAAKDATTTIKVAGAVQQAKMIKSVPPAYPEAARQARVQGTVVLHAIIGKDGLVSKLDVVSGPQPLRQAALDAVRQWRYVPTLLSGEPVAVDTTATVVFELGAAATPPKNGDAPRGQ